MCQIEILHCKTFPAPPCYNNTTIVRLNSPVNNNTVAVKDTCILHTIPLDITIKRSLWMPDIITVEVQSFMCIIVRRRRKACHYASVFQFQVGVKYTLSYFDISHNACNLTTKILNNLQKRANKRAKVRF